MDNVHDITSMDVPDEEENLDSMEVLDDEKCDAYDPTEDLRAVTEWGTQFWRSNIVKLGVIYIAIKIVNIAGEVAIERARSQQ